MHTLLPTQKRGYRALHLAAQYNHAEVARLLLRRGAWASAIGKVCASSRQLKICTPYFALGSPLSWPYSACSHQRMYGSR